MILSGLWRPGSSGKVLSARLPFAVVGGEAVMARKKSLWSELQRERERRARAARAQERANQQLVRQMVQDAERAERRAERADAAERRRQEQLAQEAGAAAAKEMKAQLDAPGAGTEDFADLGPSDSAAAAVRRVETVCSSGAV